MRMFLKDLAIYSPAQFLPALTAFITTPILTRLFAPAEYGHWAMALSIAGFLVALAVSGLGSAVVRFYPTYKSKASLDTFWGTICTSTAAVIAVVGGSTVLVLLLLKGLLPPWLVQLLPLILLVFAAQSLFGVGLAMLRAQGLSRQYTHFQLLVSYGGLGFGLLLVGVAGVRVEHLLWGTFIVLTLALPFLFSRATQGVGIHPRRFQQPAAASIWQYAWPLTLASVAMWGLRVSDLFIISSFAPARDVGIYSVSYNISAKSIELLVALFLLSVSPLIYRTWETEGRDATESALAMVSRVYLLVCVPAAVGLMVLALPFVVLLTSPEYHEGSRIVGFIVFSSLLWGLAHIAMMGLTIRQRARRLGANVALAAGAHVALQLLLVPRFGYMASAVSTLTGYAILLTLHATYSSSHLAWRFPFSTLRNVLVASAVMGAVAWGIYELSVRGRTSSPVHIVLSIAVAIPTYCLVLWWLGEVRESEKSVVLQLMKRTTRI